MIRAIVTDIEGTTSALSVLQDVLAPYARAALRAYVRHTHSLEVEQALLETRALAAAPDAGREGLIDILERWIEEDRKAPPLKILQGLLWERGFDEGRLCTHVYPDVPGALRAWCDAGYAVYVYSSGSVRAQKALFRHTSEGDLHGYFRGWFDTRVGAKRERASYAAIARELGLEPAQVLFLSDVDAELQAARAAGLLACGLARPGNAPIDGPQVTSFAALSVSTLASLIAQARACRRRGWLEAGLGALSVRHAEGVAIADREARSVHDLEQVALDAREPDERALLLAVHRARADVGAVAATHSRAATVLARRCVQDGVQLAGFAQADVLGVQDLTLPVLSGPSELATRLAHEPALPACLVAGRGLLAWAHDVPALGRRLEALEHMLACRLHELR